MGQLSSDANAPIEKENVGWESGRELFGRIGSALDQLRGGRDIGWARRSHEHRFTLKQSRSTAGTERISPSDATPCGKLLLHRYGKS